MGACTCWSMKSLSRSSPSDCSALARIESSAGRYSSSRVGIRRQLRSGIESDSSVIKIAGRGRRYGGCSMKYMSVIALLAAMAVQTNVSLADPVKMTIATGVDPSFSAFYVAKSAGIFEKNGLDVQVN